MYHMTEFNRIYLQLRARLDEARASGAISRFGLSNDEKTRLYDSHQGNHENLHSCRNFGSFVTEKTDVASSPTDPSGGEYFDQSSELKTGCVLKRKRNVGPRKYMFLNLS